jgi:hypothetical protein
MPFELDIDPNIRERERREEITAQLREMLGGRAERWYLRLEAPSGLGFWWLTLWGPSQQQQVLGGVEQTPKSIAAIVRAWLADFDAHWCRQ